MFDLVFLFIAGLLGGVINSIAGGGSFITFPALLFVGVPPVMANATNTFASSAGYISGAYAFRTDIKNTKQPLAFILLTSFIGGLVGAWLLMQTPERVFEEIIPWLLLFATLLFIYGGKINHAFKKFGQGSKGITLIGTALLFGLLFIICIYGGFFNAGLGIITLSYLVLAGYKDINVMNGMKLLISSAVSITAIVIFIFDDIIAWQAGFAVLIGTLLGGYLAALLSKQVKQTYVRNVVIVISCGITIYFFWINYL